MTTQAGMALLLTSYMRDAFKLIAIKLVKFAYVCSRYALNDGVLHRRGFDSVLLQCPTKEDSLRVMHEVHHGSLW